MNKFGGDTYSYIKLFGLDSYTDLFMSFLISVQYNQQLFTKYVVVLLIN